MATQKNLPPPLEFFKNSSKFLYRLFWQSYGPIHYRKKNIYIFSFFLILLPSYLLFSIFFLLFFLLFLPLNSSLYIVVKIFPEIMARIYIPALVGAGQGSSSMVSNETISKSASAIAWFSTTVVPTSSWKDYIFSKNTRMLNS